MKKLNTVTGQIDIDELGSVLCHEHMLIYSPIMRCAFGERLFPMAKVVDRAVEMLTEARGQCGIDTVIDGTPIDLGRNIEAIRTIAERSGVNIIVSSGLYITEEHYMHRRKPADIARYFIEECQSGVKGSKVKPGMLKCATGYGGFTEINELLLDAMSIVQCETGLPMFAHNTHDIQTGLRQIRIFDKNGVNLEKLVIGHCSDTEDIPYLLELAKSGCYLGFDRIHEAAYEKQAEVMCELIKQGYEDKLLVSHDSFAFSDSSGDSWETVCQSDRNFMIVHRKLFPELKSYGITDEQIHKLTYENPKKLFT